MTYDIVIRGGTIVDGSGGPQYRSDLAIQDGKIAAFGRIREPAREVIDANGLVVAPGFIDGHTHYGRSGLLGPAWHQLLLARGYQRRDGQLRLHARAVPSRRERVVHARSGGGRGYLGRRD